MKLSNFKLRRLADHIERALEDDAFRADVLLGDDDTVRELKYTVDCIENYIEDNPEQGRLYRPLKRK